MEVVTFVLVPEHWIRSGCSRAGFFADLADLPELAATCERAGFSCILVIGTGTGLRGASMAQKARPSAAAGARTGGSDEIANVCTCFRFCSVMFGCECEVKWNQ